MGNGLWVIGEGGTNMSGFRELKVWQKAKELAVGIYKVTKDGPFSQDFGFKDQIRRASVFQATSRKETREDPIRKLFDFSTLLKDHWPNSKLNLK